MADVKSTAGPNETARQMEQERKNRLKEAFKRSKPKDKEEPEEPEEVEEEPVDKKEETPKPEEKEETVDEKEEREEAVNEYQKVLEDTFGGDATKAVKSWKEAQKNYSKLKHQSKQDQERLEALRDLLEENPLVEDILNKTLEKGKLTQDDLQNFLTDGREPKGKPNKPSGESKLGIVDDEFDVSDVDDQTLESAGLIDPSKKDLMSSSEWELYRDRAALKYAMRQSPDQIAEKAYEKFKQRIENEKEQKQKEDTIKEINQTNSERWNQGLEQVVDEFNLDFAGNEQHREMLDEIEERAAYITEPGQPGLIRKNAVYLATIEVARENGISLNHSTNLDKKTEEAKRDAEEAFDDKTGFSTSKGVPREGNKPETLADKLRAKRLEDYEQKMKWRRQTNRLGPSE